MSNGIQYDPTIIAKNQAAARNSVWPVNGRKKLLAGGGGATVLGAVVWYLLSWHSAYEARLQAVEHKAGAVEQMQSDVRDLRDAVVPMKEDIAAIKGWIKGSREK